MCLTCRYTLDLLFDLKNLYRETSARLESVVDRELNTIPFAKIKTTVVSRKTTTPEAASIRLSTPSDTESDSSIMTRSRRASNLNVNKSKSKDRICEECKNLVKPGDDMYKLHKTNKTVCKGCWMSSDPNLCTVGRRTRQNSDTKLCTVFLKDILTETAHKKRKAYKTEKDIHGNLVYIITDESSESERSQKSSPSTTATDGSRIVTRKETRKKIRMTETARNLNMKKTLKRPSKRMKIDSTDANEKESLKKDSEDPVLEPAAQSSGVYSISTRRRTKLRSSQSSDSDMSLVMMEKTPHEVNTRRKRSSPISPSLDNSRDTPKRRKTDDGKMITMTKESDSNGSSSNEIQKKRMKKLSTSSDEQKDKRAKSSSSSESSKGNVNKKAKRTVSKPSTSSKRSKVTKNKNDERVDDEAVTEEESEKTDYTCTECGVLFESKLVGLVHQLTHFKQVELKLPKVILPDKSLDKDESDSVQMSGDVEMTPKDNEDTNEDRQESSDKEVSDDVEKEESVKESSASVNQEGEHMEPGDADNTVDLTETGEDASDTKSKEQVEDEKDFHVEVSQSKEKDTEVSLLDEPVKNTRLSVLRSRSNIKEKSVEKNLRRRRGRNSDSSKESDSCVVVSSELDVAEESDEATVTEEKKDDLVDIRNNVSDAESTPKKDQPEVEESKAVEVDDKEAESDIKITNTGSSESSVEPDVTPNVDCVKTTENDDTVILDQTDEKDSAVSIVKDADVNGTENTDTDSTKDVEANSTKDADVDSTKNLDANSTRDADVDSTKDIDANSVKDADAKSIKDLEEPVPETIAIPKDTENEDKVTTIEDADCTKTKNTENTEIVDIAEATETIKVPETTEIKNVNNTEDTVVTIDDISNISKDTKQIESDILKIVELDHENSNDSMNAATEVMKEVFDLAAAEVQNRCGSLERNSEENNDVDMETLENISREIQNSGGQTSSDAHDNKVKAV